jgi:glycosyltransferase involved in cell wall biosynthesis
MKVCVIVPVETVGYLSDANVYQKTLSRIGCNVEVFVLPEVDAIPRKIANKMIGNVCLYIDRIMPSDIISNAINCLMLNQELFMIKEHDSMFKRHLDVMKKVKYVFCKTRFGFEFAQTKKNEYKKEFIYEPIFVGHTSYFPKPPIGSMRNIDHILHVSGCHNWKGTDLIIKTWLMYPDLPKIIITGYGDSLKNIEKYISSEKMTSFLKQDNVYFIQEELTFDQIIKLKHENYFHLQPSIAEGFGHVLMESMACGGICITTNAPPMNELITPEIGFLIPVNKTEYRSNGSPMCYIDTDELYIKIKSLESMEDSQIISVSKSAYKKYKHDKLEFETNLESVINSIKK